MKFCGDFFYLERCLRSRRSPPNNLLFCSCSCLPSCGPNIYLLRKKNMINTHILIFHLNSTAVKKKESDRVISLLTGCTNVDIFYVTIQNILNISGKAISIILSHGLCHELTGMAPNRVMCSIGKYNGYWVKDTYIYPRAYHFMHLKCCSQGEIYVFIVTQVIYMLMVCANVFVNSLLY